MGAALPVRELHLQPKMVLLYFAYGANMQREKLLERGVAAESAQPAFVTGNLYHLAFRHRGGYATLVSKTAAEQACKAESQVHGVIYELREQDLAKVAKVETGYGLLSVEVQTYAGVKCCAMAFISRPSLRLKQSVAPSRRYLDLMQTGAAAHGLDISYQRLLASISPADEYTPLSAAYFDTPSALYAMLGLTALVISFTAVFLRAST